MSWLDCHQNFACLEETDSMLTLRSAHTKAPTAGCIVCMQTGISICRQLLLLLNSRL